VHARHPGRDGQRAPTNVPRALVQPRFGRQLARRSALFQARDRGTRRALPVSCRHAARQRPGPAVRAPLCPPVPAPVRLRSHLPTRSPQESRVELEECKLILQLGRGGSWRTFDAWRVRRCPPPCTTCGTYIYNNTYSHFKVSLREYTVCHKFIYSIVKVSVLHKRRARKNSRPRRAARAPPTSRARSCIWVSDANSSALITAPPRHTSRSEGSRAAGGPSCFRCLPRRRTTDAGFLTWGSAPHPVDARAPRVLAADWPRVRRGQAVETTRAGRYATALAP
jgi:hypothetical protein